MGETPTGDTIRFRLPKPKSSGDWAALLAALSLLGHAARFIAPDAQAAQDGGRSERMESRIAEIDRRLSHLEGRLDALPAPLRSGGIGR